MSNVILSNQNGLLYVNNEEIYGPTEYAGIDISSLSSMSLTNYGKIWTTKSNNRAWAVVSISSSGQYQTSCVFDEFIYVSNDYGNSWNQRGSELTSQKWQGVSLSSSGQHQTAVGFSTHICTSSDYGTTWNTKSVQRRWQSVSVSASGKYQSAVVIGGYIYISDDYGNTWNEIDINQSWLSISVSSSGQYQTAVASNNYIYISKDYGKTWVSRENIRKWQSISLSSSGEYQTAVVFDGIIYTSNDYGENWVPRETDNKRWYSISISSTGQYQTSVVGDIGGIYVSSDYGNTWTLSISVQSMRSISVSSSGQYQTGVVDGGLIYTSYCNPVGPEGETNNNTFKTVVYNTSSNIMHYHSTKTFVIDHPTDNNKYLVHACLEGPEAGVYYRGEGEITNNLYTTIYLPEYVDKISNDLTINLTPIYDENNHDDYSLKCSRVKDNKFNVYGRNCSFYWIVYGKRLDINTEPYKNQVIIKGDGPYTWI